ncbi:NAD-dependent epimerase/dehydratase family protein [Microbacterium esteraromaticum]|uniref:NAD-dependent epimerase/dehydratase family protein n=1 Tax=Microbacterium esteraromaticum TaxID=57043 RepID=A0A7D7WAV8_9MICO|nr:NAD-dependent epimerase/dehydratase family protein [Microbacterium esteraromaticum]QMU97378.1 NAD-dependent epimerase/dehydratase family protein [Microbacterium esteraromaticum]
MKVLITGGAGFIGQRVASLLVERGDTVIALDSLLPQVHVDPDEAVGRFPGEVVFGDVADQSAWASVPEFDALIHLAAETGTAQSMYERERYERVNVEGTRLAARAAARAGVPMVSLSSRAVYGEGVVGEGGALLASQEDDDHAPVSFYGETKSLAERAATEEAGERAPLTIIRPQNVIGLGQALHNPYTGVLAAFLARLREGRALSIYGDGTQTRDFVHVDDLAELILWSLDVPPGSGSTRVLNCGTGERTTLTQLAEYAIAAAPGDAVSIEYVDVHRSGDIEHACADLSRLRELEAPLPKRSTEQAVAEFIRGSWDGKVAASTVWDDALAELNDRGLASSS